MSRECRLPARLQLECQLVLPGVRTDFSLNEEMGYTACPEPLVKSILVSGAVVPLLINAASVPLGHESEVGRVLTTTDVGNVTSGQAFLHIGGVQHFAFLTLRSVGRANPHALHTHRWENSPHTLGKWGRAEKTRPYLARLKGRFHKTKSLATLGARSPQPWSGGRGRASVCFTVCVCGGLPSELCIWVGSRVFVVGG